ncbi:hypothetical protein C4N58_004354 [Salmonella enterica subsp. enterica serovar Sandiego]|nr:hypothetical protein [Salmonella enterica subsp. enterica serovar Sandiego]EDX5730462.1 hypothetical protein [Salmonella enterica subsp. enterica serovar Sandiego]
MWKPTGKRVVTAIINGKPQHSRIETYDQQIRMVSEYQVQSPKRSDS